jgi:hypothetical protein
LGTWNNTVESFYPGFWVSGGISADTNWHVYTATLGTSLKFYDNSNKIIDSVGGVGPLGLVLGF